MAPTDLAIQSPSRPFLKLSVSEPKEVYWQGSFELDQEMRRPVRGEKEPISRMRAVPVMATAPLGLKVYPPSILSAEGERPTGFKFPIDHFFEEKRDLENQRNNNLPGVCFTEIDITGIPLFAAELPNGSPGFVTVKRTIGKESPSEKECRTYKQIFIPYDEIKDVLCAGVIDNPTFGSQEPDLFN